MIHKRIIASDVSDYDVSPVVLETPYDDYWYLVVDSYPRRIKVWVTEIFD
ncbi:hypothetical protein HTZ77_24440 [Nonomuraea sp. SMC257]|uniref:DUF1883 domain-containing protein n=1 Tax=Nonomuraea montanisoli TaxID=2741721 RepID=A0A7Y6M5R3_9ACTN|nr:hypothetical protein [Nonomuraea montanisoli]NUW34564.1 hypothetical protein [Nonomuraea montanisoli]